MTTLQLDLNKKYSYSDYLTWFDNIRRELIEGFIKLMSPAPSIKHQKISFNISRLIGNFLYKKECKAFYAPSDVRFLNDKKSKNDKNIFTVVQPDIYVVCDLSKLDEKGCIGAPDLIVEIISPGNAKHDIKTKYDLYEKHGVTEYWIVHPNDRTVIVSVLDQNNKYKQVGLYAEDMKIPVNIFNGKLEIDLIDVFDE